MNDYGALSTLTQLLILYGPPGTGKTYRLRQEVTRMAQAYGLDHVFVASFSKSAARNIADLAGLPPMQCNTLHSLCYRALDYPTLAETKIADFMKIHKSYKLTPTTKNKLDDPNDDDSRDDSLLATYSRLRSKMQSRAAWSQRLRIFADKWDAWKKDNNYVDFTDLIDLCRVRYGPKPKGMEVLIIDEAQDLTPNQHALVMEWGSHCQHVILAGDDDQTIFQHTGATADYLTDDTIPASCREVLGQSVRVPATVQAVADTWIKKVDKRVDKPYRPRDAIGRVRTSPATWGMPDKAINAAQAMIAQGDSVMFLTSCGYMLEPLIKQLRERGIPFWNPLRARGDWNPLAQRGTTTVDRILAFLRPRGDVWGDDARMWTASDLHMWTDLIKVEGVMRRGAKLRIEDLVTRNDSDRDYAARCGDAYTEPEIALQDMIDLYFWPDVFDHIIDCDLDWLAAHLVKSKEHAAQFPLAVLKKSGPEYLRADPLITVSTIHAAKGNEAEHVFLFPDLSPAGDEEWQSIGAGHDAIVRQFYVGITRAKQDLIVCTPGGAMFVRLPLYAALAALGKKAAA